MIPAQGIDPSRRSGVNQKPSWVNLNKDSVANINGKWSHAVSNRQKWGKDWKPGRVDYWDDWSHGVRHNWRDNYDFDVDISDIDANFNGWHYGRGGFYRQYDEDWWIAPAFGAVAGFFASANTADNTFYSEPIIYDYGEGGNVVYQNDAVYIGGEQVASAGDFAESAAALSTVDPPPSADAATSAEWLPLGRFAMITDKDDTAPNRTIELAVDKEGIIAGVLYNTDTDQGSIIQGKVDKKTQRAAFRLGDNDQCIVETGIYNLTLDEAPCLVHFGKDKVENYLLVRLPAPPAEAEAAAPVDTTAK